MGWAVGFNYRWQRDIGYGVPATCDHPGCGIGINRGLSYVCGGEPYGGEHGCGLHFCPSHLFRAGYRRNNTQLCSRCYGGRGQPYTPTPDVRAWNLWKLRDPSWCDWRRENPALVKAIRKALRVGKDAQAQRLAG